MVKDLTTEEIELLIEDIREKRYSITTKLIESESNNKQMEEEEEEENEIQKLIIQELELNYIITSRENGYDYIVLPTVFDGEQIQFGIDEDKYTLGSSLDGKKILLGKTDGSKLTANDEIIPKKLINLIALYSIETGLIKHLDQNIKMSQYPADDQMFIITECTFTPTTNKTTEESYSIPNQPENKKQTPMQKLKSVFKRHNHSKKNIH